MEPKISEETKIKIINGVLGYGLPYCQVFVPGLEKFTQKQIEDIFNDLLINGFPNEMQGRVDVPPFSVEEDFALLLYSQSNEFDSVEAFAKANPNVFKQFRTRASLRKRVAAIKQMNPKETKTIIKKYAKQCVINDMQLHSKKAKNVSSNVHLLTTSTCPFNNVNRTIINKRIDPEISSLTKSLPFLTMGIFEENDLAILMTERLRFHMKSCYITIGRSSQCDCVNVNLSFCEPNVCNHVSRVHAILHFMPDCNFYLENIGKTIFRVNGVIINPKGITKLADASLIDFSEVLLIFC